MENVSAGQLLLFAREYELILVVSLVLLAIDQS